MKREAKQPEIPFEETALDARSAGLVLGVSARCVREELAKLTNFPRVVSPPGKRPRWRAGDILEFRNLIQVSPLVRRRLRRSTS